MSARYLLSVEDGDMVGCFLEYNVMGVLPNLNKYAPVDLLSLMHLTQSTSKKPIRVLASLLRYRSPVKTVALR
jgi:hypothetical protein